MAKEIAMRRQEDEYFVDAGAALAIRSLREYNEIAPKAMLKIEGGSQQQDQWHCRKMMIVHTKVEYDDCLQDWRARGRRSWWLATTMGYSLQEEGWIVPKAATKIDDGLQRQEWWCCCKRVCGSRSSGQRKLKIACGKINGIIARGSLDCAESFNKNERWFVPTRSTASLWEEARHTIAQAGRKAHNGRVTIGQEDEFVHSMGCGNGMRQPRLNLVARQCDVPAKIEDGGAAMGCASKIRGWARLINGAPQKERIILRLWVWSSHGAPQKERTELEREMSSSRKCEMFSLLMN
jgi:hypothetical protein